MKKSCIFLIATLFFIGFVTSACEHKPKANLIQAKRRFAQYSENTQNKDVVDLSEGPKLDYRMDIGPQNLNFDIKIIDPY